MREDVRVTRHGGDLGDQDQADEGQTHERGRRRELRGLLGLEEQGDRGGSGENHGPRVDRHPGVCQRPRLIAQRSSPESSAPGSANARLACTTAPTRPASGPSAAAMISGSPDDRLPPASWPAPVEAGSSRCARSPRTPVPGRPPAAPGRGRPPGSPGRCPATGRPTRTPAPQCGHRRAASVIIGPGWRPSGLPSTEPRWPRPRLKPWRRTDEQARAGVVRASAPASRLAGTIRRAGSTFM